MKKAVRKPRKVAKQPVDWEKLARQLQEALAKEMKENERLEKDNDRLQIELVQASGIIKYLEIKYGSDSI